MAPDTLKPALFLDRDGVVNVERHYVHRVEDFEFVEGIFELCRLAITKGMLIVIITNQAGIGRGYYSEAQFLALTNWMNARFNESGAPVSGVYFCPFHPEHGVGKYKRDSFDRKPNPGMILRARDDLNLDLARSILIGDKPSDIVAGNMAAVGYTVLIGENTGDSSPSRIISSLSEACLLLNEPPPLTKHCAAGNACISAPPRFSRNGNYP
jgi:D-glycero-D-manno-heptose 1,7-bisphosphate phosphatase